MKAASGEWIEAFLEGRGHNANAIRDEMRTAGVEAVIPANMNRHNPAWHDRTKYEWRNLIERLFNKPRNWRRIATPYEKPGNQASDSSHVSVKLWIPFVRETWFEAAQRQ